MHRAAIGLAALLPMLLALQLGAARANAAPDQPAAKSSTDDLSFELFDKPTNPAFDLAAERRAAAMQKAVRTRRRTLETHQVLGLLTLAALAATSTIGTLNYWDKYGGGGDTGRYAAAHLGLSLGTSATFATTGLLGLLAPTPYKKPIRLDAALAHKVLMGLATACFVAELLIGPLTAGREGKLDQRDLAGAHLGIGYGAFAAMTAGWLAFVVR